MTFASSKSKASDQDGVSPNWVALFCAEIAGVDVAGSSHAPIWPKPAITLSRKDWRLSANGSGTVSVPGAWARFGILPRRPDGRGGVSVVAAHDAAPTSRYASQFANCHASTTCSHSVRRKCWPNLSPLTAFAGLLHKFAYLLAAGNRCLPDMRLVQPQANGVERVDVNPLRETRFVVQQPSQLGLQRIRQCIGEGRKQNSGIRVGARQMRSPVNATMVLPVPAEPEIRTGPV